MQNEEGPPGDLAIRTKDFALRIIRLVSALPKNSAARVIGHQVLRSGTSIGANYREARRARSKAEFTAKIGDCLKEADETAYWLELLDEACLIPTHKLTALHDETNQLIAILVTTLKTSKGQN